VAWHGTLSFGWLVCFGALVGWMGMNDIDGIDDAGRGDL
jgi:hypothetical protein